MKKLGILIVFGMITSFVGAAFAEEQLVIPDGRFEGFILDEELLGQAIANQVDSISSVFNISIEDVADWEHVFRYLKDRFQITFMAAVSRGPAGRSTYYRGISCTVYDQYVDQPDTLWLVDCGNDQVKFANKEMEISVSEVVSTVGGANGGRGLLR